MANPIVQQISAELENLHKELGQFKSTVDYLNGAKGHVNEAVQSVNQAEVHFNKKIDELKATYNAFIQLTDAVAKVLIKVETINFPERLDSIEKTVLNTITILNDTKNSTIEELQKASEIITKADFDGRFKKLQAAVDVSVNSNNYLADSIKKQNIPEKINSFEKEVRNDLNSSITTLNRIIKQFAADETKSIQDLNIPTRMDKLDANVSGLISAIQNVQSRMDNVERNLTDRLKDLNENHKENSKLFNEKLSSITKQQKKTSYITWVLIVLGTLTVIFI